MHESEAWRRLITNWNLRLKWVLLEVAVVNTPSASHSSSKTESDKTIVTWRPTPEKRYKYRRMWAERANGIILYARYLVFSMSINKELLVERGEWCVVANWCDCKCDQINVLADISWHPSCDIENIELKAIPSGINAHNEWYFLISQGKSLYICFILYHTQFRWQFRQDL